VHGRTANAAPVHSVARACSTAPGRARAGMMNAPVGGHMPAQRLVAERRWRLGVHSRGHPSAVVAELLRALQVRRAAPCAPLGVDAWWCLWWCL